MHTSFDNFEACTSQAPFFFLDTSYSKCNVTCVWSLIYDLCPKWSMIEFGNNCIFLQWQKGLTTFVSKMYNFASFQGFLKTCYTHKHISMFCFHWKSICFHQFENHMLSGKTTFNMMKLLLYFPRNMCVEQRLTQLYGKHYSLLQAPPPYTMSQ